jgi:hypothetical protein
MLDEVLPGKWIVDEVGMTEVRRGVSACRASVGSVGNCNSCPQLDASDWTEYLLSDDKDLADVRQILPLRLVLLQPMLAFLVRIERRMIGLTCSVSETAEQIFRGQRVAVRCDSVAPGTHCLCRFVSPTCLCS